ncbi:SID1 transmembrane family member 1-like [Diadema antillarum]|uniref:SID1 transmembrane family member 1-like n=1 Tax=Diadema antillarum TaxID=105358 RepID=UPI003A89BF8F
METIRVVVCIAVLLQLCAQFSSAINANFDEIYDGTVSSASAVEYRFTHDVSESEAARVYLESPNAEADYPILMVVKRPRSILSWAVPDASPNQFSPELNDTYHYISHTLCRDDFVINGAVEINIVISTSSVANLSFSLNVSLIRYVFKSDEIVTFDSDPATPQYYEFNFKKGVDMIFVRAESNNDFCAYFSVQRAKCPVYDSVSTVRYNEGSSFQTMTKKAAITITRDRFKDSSKFLVVFVVHPNDQMCHYNYTPSNRQSETSHHWNDSFRRKTVTITVEERYFDYWKPILTTFAVTLAIYLLAGVILVVYWCKTKQRDEKSGAANEQDDNELGEVPDPVGESRMSNFDTADTTPETVERQGEDGSTKENIQFVSGLYTKNPNYLQKKYKLYTWMVIIVSLFFALPVVQLVVRYQQVIKITGNEDYCYYNFKCAKPFLGLSAFNNVFGNIGYVLLGVLFLLLVLRRELIHKKRLKEENGIPEHYGLFYALGYALIMEGVMSASYHVCPNRANYQFDTAYMYVIACLGILTMYQQRHPDITAKAYHAFLGFASILYIGFLGFVFTSAHFKRKTKPYGFYAVFFIVHMITCLLLSARVYYAPFVKFNKGLSKIIRSIQECSHPRDKKRLALFSVGLLVNLALSIAGLVMTPDDFSTFLLAIMIVNMLLYLTYYVIMKLIYRGDILRVVIKFILPTIFLWIPALIFFLLPRFRVAAWEDTPAESRERNKSCVVLDFFDYHDVWHFLSAVALFLSFVVSLSRLKTVRDQGMYFLTISVYNEIHIVALTNI